MQASSHFPEPEEEELDAAILQLADEALDIGRDQVQLCRATVDLQWELRGPTGRKRRLGHRVNVTVPVREDPLTGLGVMISQIAKQLQRELITSWPEPPED